ncbi:DUF1707 SHOCT-like domain-containing protein [Micromonospora pattaloongensis]|uniref:DUF1707 SHOCT-like domain-containing protein n=1 Tax=Micromonospora pattaloongensis TaxID=405436 RepID=UPI001587A06E|nr:DUF1707 domain-containing protein [Micromonospora pattaloongensis]
MTSTEDRPPEPDVRIGTPERRAAQTALEEHLSAKRLDVAEFERRFEASERASTQAELLRIFADLPAPHPEMPSATAAPDAEDENIPIPPLATAGCLTLGLGLPVAVVLGYVYDAWWGLIVPVAVTVAMAYIEHLRTPGAGVAKRDDDD